jgi:hypothetical protein
MLDAAVGETLDKFKEKNLAAKDVAATLIDLRDATNPRWANVRGEEKIYPASVSKMFYMVALERWLEDGRLKLTPEMERGLKDMIVDSSNEATQYILDVLTGTSSGAELPEKEFESGRSSATSSTVISRRRTIKHQRQPENVLRGRLRHRAAVSRLQGTKPQHADNERDGAAVGGDRFGENQHARTHADHDGSDEARFFGQNRRPGRSGARLYGHRAHQ